MTERVSFVYLNGRGEPVARSESYYPAALHRPERRNDLNDGLHALFNMAGAVQKDHIAIETARSVAAVRIGDLTYTLDEIAAHAQGSSAQIGAWFAEAKLPEALAAIAAVYPQFR